MSSGVRNMLLPLSALYGAAIAVRNFGYDNHILKVKKLPLPVASVGNIAVGGSGKTPFVMYLIEKVLSMGKKPAVLSRGYKRMTRGLIISCPGKGLEADVQLLGDEPALISHAFPNVPVAVEKDRYKAGLEVIERFAPNVFILDDGFQNRELHRDVEFVLLRSSLDDLKDSLLPAGNLRDSRKRVWQADVLVLTSHGDWDIPDRDLVKNYSNAPLAGVSFIPHDLVDCCGQHRSLGTIAGTAVAAFCGIARPEEFFREIESLGAKFSRKQVFRDHHWYDEYDIDEVFGGYEDLIAVTTCKDAARIFQDDELAEKEEVKRIYALREKAVVNFGEEYLDKALSKLFGGIHA